MKGQDQWKKGEVVDRQVDTKTIRRFKVLDNGKCVSGVWWYKIQWFEDDSVSMTYPTARDLSLGF